MEGKNYLPIKIFKKRSSDDRKTEGGGSGNEPSWILNDEELKIKSLELISVIEGTIEKIKNRSESESFIPTVVTLTIDDDAIAKSHRTEIKKVFNVNNKSNIIGFAHTNNLLIKVDNIDDAVSIEDNVKSFTKFRRGLSAIQDIENFKPVIGIGKELDEKKVLKASLINYVDYSLNNAIKQSFINLCQSVSIKVQEVFYSSELMIFRLTNITDVTIHKISQFTALESLTFMPEYRIEVDSLASEISVNINKPIEGIDYPTVGILDSGIKNIEHLKPWLLDNKHSNYPDEYINKGHGTFVAGILLYGDALEDKYITGLEGCKLFDATVFPDPNKESIKEDELVNNIREAVSKNNHIKIWNMSLGTHIESDINTFSHIGMALDNIQDVHNILICKSAGNCNNFLQGRPVSRIAKSADSIRSLVVGSLAHKKNQYDFAEIDNPSPFSRIGYAPAQIIKPELVSYGGNAGTDKSGNLKKNGVCSFGIDGKIMYEVGTSFSTPRVTGLLAALSFNINEDFDPILLKALVIHSASYPDVSKIPVNEKLKQFGFGLPKPVNEIVYNSPHEITLIQQDTLIKGDFFEILEFPYPESLVNDEGFYYGEVKITLVTSPILEDKQGAEYCQSNIDVFFGTYDKLTERDVTKPNILNEIGPDGNKNLLNSGCYSKRHYNDTSSDFARERMLISYGKKYQPIKKWVVNLEEMTNANKENYLKNPKKWYLKVSGLYRDFIETRAVADGLEISQDFCLIITIRDTKEEKNIYSEVSSLLDSRNFIHHDIRLRSETQLTVETK